MALDTSMKIAQSIVDNCGECGGLMEGCDHCPAGEVNAHYEDGCTDTPCGMRFYTLTGTKIGSPPYMETKTQWFNDWIKSQGGTMNSTEQIRAMERRLDEMREQLDSFKKKMAPLVKTPDELDFDNSKSYVAVNDSDEAYYLISHGDNSDAYYAWHDLSYNPSLTWDGEHATGQRALDSIMEEAISGPWVIHEFSTGAGAMAFYLSTME